MARIRPLHNKILLTNLERGERTTKGGIIIADDSKITAGERGIRARWAEVYAVGPDQDDVKVGDWVLMDLGRWTEEYKLEDDGSTVSIWMGDPDGVLGISDNGRPDGV